MESHQSPIALGWDDQFENQFQAVAPNYPEAIPARIIREDRGHYRAIHKDLTYTASVTGKFRHDFVQAEQYPAVGDWVIATHVGDEDKLQIHAVLDRRTVFKRIQAGSTSEIQVVAANVNTVFIVMGVDGDFNPRRAERYITLAYESGASPVLILSKCDLIDGLEFHLEALETVSVGVPIHPISSVEGKGVEDLAQYLGIGQTVACLGSSGAGKSTLINALLGTEAMDTGAVREDDSRGRHTTTFRQLLPLPNGGALIDTPGMRELQLTGDESSLSHSFEDVEAIATQCRFRDCAHETEAGCAIQEAIANGDLSPERLKSYHKLQRELDYTNRRQSESFEHEERKRNKSLNKMYKRVQKESRRQKGD